MSTPLTFRALRITGFAVAAAGTAYTGMSYYQRRSLFQTVQAEAPATTDAKKVTWSGFTDLKLESAELVNHNVKRLRFALPDTETVTGLEPVSEC